MTVVKISSTNHPEQIAPSTSITAKVCDTFISRLKGFMFQRTIQSNEALLFENKSESRLDAAIHMFFMKFDIAVFWLDKNNQLVDKKIARKWRPIYYPLHPAKMILETHTGNFDFIDIGDRVNIEIC